ncbi:MAG: hypothetical protein ACTSRE_00015 [Promethearchaeota archaeon]
MSQKDHIAFKCSECSELFPKELVDEILKGKTVLCERCGFPFRSQFTKKDYKEMGSPPIQAPVLKRKQTVAYSKNRPKKKSKPVTKSAQKYRYEPPPKRDKKKRKHEIQIDTSGIKTRIPDKDIDNIKKAIRITNDIVGSPLIIIIGILILGSTIPGAIISMQTDLYLGIMKIVVNSFRFAMILYMWSLNYRLIIKPVRNGSYTNLGIDAILLGLISLPLYGLGTLILFEGIFILLYQIFTRSNNLYDVGKRDELSQEILGANLSESGIKVMNEFLVPGTAFLLVYSIIPILKNVRDFTMDASGIGSLAYHAVFFGIAFAYTIYLKAKFTKVVNSKAYQTIPEDILIKNIVFSSFSLIYAGVGVLGLLISIVLFGYRKMYKDIKQKLPSIQYVKPKLPPQPSVSKNLDSRTPAPIAQLLSKSEDKQSTPVSTPPRKEKGSLQEIPVMRVDDKEARKQLITSLNQSEKQKPGTPPGKPPINDKADIKEYMDRVFTVLTANMRDRLLSLEIPEDQKWEVIREFVNLKQSQQQKYLDELENVNRVLSEQLIKRVKKMKLPKKEADSVINQLEIMDPKEQVQFVEFLEHSQ